jgi:uncharacterized membrane protein YccC
VSSRNLAAQDGIVIRKAGEWVARHRAEMGLSLRITIAGLLAFAVGHLISLTQVYWAVLIARPLDAISPSR